MRKLLYEITHTTSYDYLEDVSVSQHLLKLTPRRYSKQNCLADELVIVRTEEACAAPHLGQTLCVTPRPGKIHHFDTVTGKRKDIRT